MGGGQLDHQKGRKLVFQKKTTTGDSLWLEMFQSFFPFSICHLGFDTGNQYINRPNEQQLQQRCHRE